MRDKRNFLCKIGNGIVIVVVITFLFFWLIAIWLGEKFPKSKTDTLDEILDANAEGW